jgi:pheromone shutdown protein TraB
MATQLAEEWNRGDALIAVVGAGHLPEVRPRLPELGVVVLDYSGLVTGTAVVPER